MTEIKKKKIRPKRTGPRPTTLSARITQAAFRKLKAEGEELPTPLPPLDRPADRSECRGTARPCPWVSCKYHLYLDVEPRTGTLKINFPDIEPHQMKNSCALDLADEGTLTLEEVGKVINITRERVRQIEIPALKKLRKHTKPMSD